MKKSTSILYFLAFLFHFQIIAQDILINEIMSSNDNIIMDEDGDYSDWIELYNNSSQTINLNNWSLSDKGNELDKWSFPNIEIEGGGYLLIYASGKNKTGNELHSNFKIDNGNEDIFLSDEQGDIKDMIPSIFINSNISYGRKIDGSNNFFYFETPSPNSSNNDNTGIPIPTETMTFSHETGWYNEAFLLDINSSAGHDIYYTLDGSDPSLQSNLFNEKILINSKENIPHQISNIPTSPEYWEIPKGNVFQINTIRTASFNNGFRTSPIYSKSYLLHTDSSKRFPVETISLITDNENLFDDSYGIHVFGNGNKDQAQSGNYYNTGKDWERNVHFEYFNKEGNLEINQDVGMRIHGFFSRQLPQKSIRIYARNEYGEKYLNHPFFEQKPEVGKYKRLVLRSANPNYFHIPFKDELCHLLVKEMGMGYQAFKPVVVFINGEYWGIFNLKERHDEYYIQENYNIDKDDVNFLEKEGNIISGISNDFWQLKAFVENNNLSITDNYNEVKEFIDVNNFIDFLIAEMYFELWDFPEQNLKFWNSENTKFQWLFNDGDSAMHEYWKSKLLEIIFSENTDAENLFFTTLVIKLLENEAFKEKLYSQFLYHINHTLSPGNVLGKIDSLQRIYDPLMSEHINRWGYPNTMNDYHAAVNHLKSFAALRPPTLINDLRDLFGKPFIAYPNPVESELNVSFIEGFDDSTVQYSVSDIMGRIRQQGKIENNRIDLSHFNAGIYFLSLNINGINYVEKISKR